MHSIDDQAPYATRVPAVLLLLILFAFSPCDARAQMFSYGGDRPRSVQSVSFVYQLIEFTRDGEGQAGQTFDFSGPAYGLTYARPNVTASIVYGPESEDDTRDLRLLDATIATWGEVVLSGSPTSDRLFLPIGLQSNYRRVAPRGSENSLVDSFNLTVLALGAGLGYTADLRESARFEIRAMPMIGIALRAFGESTGVSYLLDTDARLHLLEVAGRVGLSAGYAFRLQSWNVSGSDLLLGVQDDLFDYSSAQHVFTIGINW
ncbi:MAG: hypothetical protein WD021_02435 [Rhodothermales bacterium]